MNLRLISGSAFHGLYKFGQSNLSEPEFPHLEKRDNSIRCEVIVKIKGNDANKELNTGPGTPRSINRTDS